MKRVKGVLTEVGTLTREPMFVLLLVITLFVLGCTIAGGMPDYP